MAAAGTGAVDGKASEQKPDVIAKNAANASMCMRPSLLGILSFTRGLTTTTPMMGVGAITKGLSGLARTQFRV